MPNRWPITSGNWSNSATWSGSIIPTASDDVFANNQIVTIDTNITVTSLRNSATSSAIAQGTYIINNGVTITSPTIISSTGSMMLISQSNSATIIGNLSCATTASAICVSMSATSSLTITGNISTGGNATNIRGIVNSSIGTLRISGSINAPGNSTSYTLYKPGGTGTVIITGSIFGAVATTIRHESNSTSYYILGDLISTTTPCFQDNAGGTSNPQLYITGNIYAGPNQPTATIYKTGTGGFFSVSGSVIAGGVAAIEAAASTIIINGAIIASNNAPAVATGTGLSIPAGIVYATGPFYNVNNRNAVFTPNLQLISGSTPTWTFDTETYGTQRTLYTDRDPQTYPSASDVRTGITYGATNELTGSVIIPPTSSVTQGVLVDTATGSASFTIQNAWTIPTSSLTGSTAIGTRLKNTATVANVAAAISSKGTI